MRWSFFEQGSVVLLVYLKIYHSVGFLESGGVHYCAGCNGVDHMYQCSDIRICPGQHCYIQIYKSAKGQSIYGGCAADSRCDHYRRTAISSTAGKFLCGDCCQATNLCNMRLCSMPMFGEYVDNATTTRTSTVKTTHTSTTTSTDTPTTKTTTTIGAPVTSTMPLSSHPPQIECEVCTGDLCGTEVKSPYKQCTPDKPLCMNTIENYANGDKIVTKSCASVSECEAKWWHSSSITKQCTNFDPSEIYTRPFICNYCCTAPHCNTHDFPLQETLYRGRPFATPTASLTPPTPPPQQVTCEVCDYTECQTNIKPNLVTCPLERPYCMNTVHNFVNGAKQFKKECASVMECEAKWWKLSSHKLECAKFHKADVYPFDFECNYCCITSECNINLTPDIHTLYKVHL